MEEYLQCSFYHIADQIDGLVALKNKNPSLNIMVGIGGPAAGTMHFEAMSQTHATRATFIDNVVSFMRSHKLDGFSLEWEFPSSNYKDRFTLLVLVRRFFLL